jgi:hypothetical protein
MVCSKIVHRFSRLETENGYFGDVIEPTPKSKPSPNIDHLVNDSKHHSMPPSGGGKNGGMAGFPLAT